MLYLGSPSTQREIAAIFARRRYELQISTRCCDWICGLPDGLNAKIECGTKRVGVMSFTSLCGAMGICWLVHDGQLHLFADDEALPAMTRRYLRTCQSRPGSPNPRRKVPRPALAAA